MNERNASISIYINYHLIIIGYQLYLRNLIHYHFVVLVNELKIKIIHQTKKRLKRMGVKRDEKELFSETTLALWIKLSEEDPSFSLMFRTKSLALLTSTNLMIIRTPLLL